MAQIPRPNEELGEEEELVETDHRDAARENVTPDEEQPVETPEESPREALEELGEDVASSPARRGQRDEDPEGEAP